MSTNPRVHTRRRASSVSQALSAIPLNNAPAYESRVPATATENVSAEQTDSNPSLQLNGSADSFTAAEVVADEARAAQLRRRRPGNDEKPVTEAVAALPGDKKLPAKRNVDPFDDARYKSDGLWQDLRTGKWMLIPSSSLPILVLPILLYLNHEYILTNPNIPLPDVFRQIVPVTTKNPWTPLLFLSGFDGRDEAGTSFYKRSWLDLLFIAYHIVFFSFVRQSITLYFLRPLVKRLGIPPAKFERFTEQGYAFIYFGFFGPLGMYVMHGLPIWWYNTSAFWSTFPVLRMTGLLKAYYLLQGSYWCQQAIILAAGVEKPRKDFKELIAHHIVTLWLIGWSYMLTLTYIGVAVYVTMDVSDIFLALAKCVNYVSEDASAPFFAFFVLVWTYMRHYLNLKILYSVWTEFDLVPEWARTTDFEPWKETGLLAWWIQPIIFASIFFLQLINLFWYFLILRILFRALFSKSLSDERSDEDE